MTKKPTTVRYTLTEIKQQIARGKDKTRADAPEGPKEDSKFWNRARVVVPPGKTSVHLRVDSDVLEWFKKQCDGHLTRMNAVFAVLRRCAPPLGHREGRDVQHMPAAEGAQ